MVSPSLFPHDLTDLEWDQLLRTLSPEDRQTLLAPRKYDGRDILNALLYIAHNPTASWRSIPHQRVPWRTVRFYAQKWCDQGISHRLDRALKNIRPDDIQSLHIFEKT